MTPRLRIVIPISAALALVLAAGCRNGNKRDTAPAATPARDASGGTAAGTGNETGETMREHFDAIDAVKVAVVDGDLAAAQREVSRIVERPIDPGLTAWQPHVEAMRSIGRELQRATDIRSAARATARLGASCGSCHESLGHRPQLATEPEPAAGGGLEARMQRHQWAADRMWEGLVLPSDEAWKAGAAVLAEAPLLAEPEPTDMSIVDQLAAEVQGLATRAKTAPPEERAAIFGQALGTCGQCHRLIRPE